MQLAAGEEARGRASIRICAKAPSRAKAKVRGSAYAGIQAETSTFVFIGREPATEEMQSISEVHGLKSKEEEAALQCITYYYMEGEDYEREIAGYQRRGHETDPAV